MVRGNSGGSPEFDENSAAGLGEPRRGHGETRRDLVNSVGGFTTAASGWTRQRERRGETAYDGTAMASALT